MKVQFPAPALVSLAVGVIALLVGCGTSGASSTSTATAATASPSVATPSPSAGRTSPTPLTATKQQLIAVAQQVYGTTNVQTCERGTSAVTLFDTCPFTAAFKQKMITKAQTQLGPDPLGLGDGPGPGDARLSYAATVTSTGGTVVLHLGTFGVFVLTEVWQGNTLVVSDIATDGASIAP